MQLNYPFTPVPDWLMRKRGISHGAKLTWARLHRLQQPRNPSTKWLAKELAVSRHQIMRYISELSDHNLLIVRRINGERSAYEPVADVQPVADMQQPCSISATAPVADTLQHKETMKNTKRRQRKVRSHFIKPVLEEVTAYCKERGNSIDSEAFIDYYESIGWKVSKNPMKDWRATVRNWERRDKVNKQPSTPTVIQFNQMDPEEARA